MNERADSGLGDEHITRALRLTSVEIRQVADRLGLAPYQVRAVLIAAGALGDKHITRAARALFYALDESECDWDDLVTSEKLDWLDAAAVTVKAALGALGDEHVTRAARVLLEELPPTDLTIETMGEAAAHEEWRKIAARMLEAAAGGKP